MSDDRRSRPLYRDPEDGIIGGVCSGLGHYFDIDTTLVRVAFIVVTVLGGGGALGYVILWAILKPAPPGMFGQPQDDVTAEPLVVLDEVTDINLVPPHDRNVAEPPSTGSATEAP